MLLAMLEGQGRIKNNRSCGWVSGWFHLEVLGSARLLSTMAIAGGWEDWVLLLLLGVEVVVVGLWVARVRGPVMAGRGRGSWQLL